VRYSRNRLKYGNKGQVYPRRHPIRYEKLSHRVNMIKTAKTHGRLVEYLPVRHTQRGICNIFTYLLNFVVYLICLGMNGLSEMLINL